MADLNHVAEILEGVAREHDEGGWDLTADVLRRAAADAREAQHRIDAALASCNDPEPVTKTPAPKDDSYVRGLADGSGVLKSVFRDVLEGRPA